MPSEDRYRLAKVADLRARDERIRRGDLAVAVGDARQTEARLEAARARSAAARTALAAAVAARDALTGTTTTTRDALTGTTTTTRDVLTGTTTTTRDALTGTTTTTRDALPTTRDALPTTRDARTGTTTTTRDALVCAEQFITRRRGELERALGEELRAEAAHDARLGSLDEARRRLARARADREIIERHFARWREARKRLADRRED